MGGRGREGRMEEGRGDVRVRERREDGGGKRGWEGEGEKEE